MGVRVVSKLQTLVNHLSRRARSERQQTDIPELPPQPQLVDLSEDEIAVWRDLLSGKIGEHLSRQRFRGAPAEFDKRRLRLQRIAELFVALRRGSSEDLSKRLMRELREATEKEHLGYQVWDLCAQAGKKRMDEAHFITLQFLAEQPSATAKMLHEYAHALRRKRHFGQALAVYDRLLSAFPDRDATRFERARLLVDHGRADLALPDLAILEPRMATKAGFHYERGRCYEKLEMTAAAKHDFESAGSVPRPEARGYLRLSEMHMRANQRKEAIEALTKALAIKPRDAEMRMRRARIYSELDNWPAALKDATLASKNSGQSAQTERFMAEMKARYRHEHKAKRQVLIILPQTDVPEGLAESLITQSSSVFAVAGLQMPDGQILKTDNQGKPAAENDVMASFLAESRVDYVWFVDQIEPEEQMVETLAELIRGFAPNLAAVCSSFSTPEHTSNPLVDAQFLKLLLTAQTSTFPSQMSAQIARQEFDAVTEYCNIMALDDSDQSRPVQIQDGEVWLVSNSGINKFGGVEHFLRGLYTAYGEMSLDSVIVGFVAQGPSAGEIDDIPFLNTSRDPARIMQLILERRPQIVHGTTGVGYELLAVAKYFRCSMVYGTHFWRDMFYGRDWFGDADKNQTRRKDFHQLAALAEHPYANSIYSAELIHSNFGHAQDIIYSLPPELDLPKSIASSADKKGAVLLLNARPEKGYDLILDVAAQLPQIEFLCVASQSEADIARLSVSSKRLNNIKIIERVSDPNELYQQAHVVVVPSYSFVETFSRVVIEAHRHGLPVLGSNRGNVPVLLEQSGHSLPEDTDVWAEEIRRLYEDDAYYRAKSEAASENSKRYAFSRTHESIKRVVGAHRNRVAVGVGSGIGNVVETIPLLNRLARHFGGPVDVLVSSDFNQSVCVFNQHPAVANAFVYDENSAQRRYDTIIVLDCFGRIPPSNFARTKVNTRDFAKFGLMQAMSESEFNLYGVQEALKISYEEDDIYDLDMRHGFPPQPEPGVVGIHGGSKKNIYAAKQWPYFQTLVEQLKQAGYEVRSFGATDEYIPGSQDFTGTPLIETIRNMSKCAYFVSNDSGLMHIADALHIPLVTIFAPTSVLKNGPLNPSARVVSLDKNCAPCQFNKAQFETCKCIGEIPLSSVVDELIDIGINI